MTNQLYPALSTTEEDAFALIRAATNISRARKQNDAAALTIALDENLQLWTAIQTLMEKKEHPLPAQTKENLLKLSRFVVAKTIAEGCEASDKTLDTLENMNLQIARGLMESIRFQVIRGNVSEIKTLALGSGKTRGVDADAADTVTDRNLDAMVDFAKAFAARTGATVAITGERPNSISQYADLWFRVEDPCKLDDQNVRPNTFFPQALMLTELIAYEYHRLCSLPNEDRTDL